MPRDSLTKSRPTSGQGQSSISDLLKKRSELKMAPQAATGDLLRSISTPASRTSATIGRNSRTIRSQSPEIDEPKSSSPLRQSRTKVPFRRVPSAGSYADERKHAADTLKQTMEMLGRGNSWLEGTKKNTGSSRTMLPPPEVLDPPSPPMDDSSANDDGPAVAGKATAPIKANESVSERARRLLAAAHKNNSAENLMLGNMYGRSAGRMEKALSLDTAPPAEGGSQKDAAGKKHVSLVSSEVLNTFKQRAIAFRNQTSAASGPMSGSMVERSSASFGAFLEKTQSTKRPMSGRTRKLLGQLPQDHAGQIFINPHTGNREVLYKLKMTREAMTADMDACRAVLKNSSSLLQSHFRGLTSRQLSERIYIAFQTYDTSSDGLLQETELYQACVSFGMDVDADEVGAFAATYGTDGELNPKQFESMVRVAMGLEHADDVAEHFQRSQSDTAAAAASKADDGAGSLFRVSSAPDEPSFV
mmetsp:Transcript_20652/g.30338  ORF Transcript_20652/g.30338 Transcript_20652/m.30338 type:complete len:474 (-) Transcript_20652:484-1905(-)